MFVETEIFVQRKDTKCTNRNIFTKWMTIPIIISDCYACNVIVHYVCFSTKILSCKHDLKEVVLTSTATFRSNAGSFLSRTKYMALC